MKKFVNIGFRLCALAFIGIVIGCADKQATSGKGDIEGIWIEMMDDEVSFVYEMFGDDGTCVSGLYIPASATSGGMETQAEFTYKIDGNVLKASAGTSVSKFYEYDGSVARSTSHPFDALETTLMWESEDVLIIVMDDGEEFRYTRVNELPSKLRF